MVRNQGYRDKESGLNSFDFQPSKMKHVLAGNDHIKHWFLSRPNDIEQNVDLNHIRSFEIFILRSLRRRFKRAWTESRKWGLIDSTMLFCFGWER